MMADGRAKNNSRKRIEGKKDSEIHGGRKKGGEGGGLMTNRHKDK